MGNKKKLSLVEKITRLRFMNSEASLIGRYKRKTPNSNNLIVKLIFKLIAIIGTFGLCLTLEKLCFVKVCGQFSLEKLAN